MADNDKTEPPEADVVSIDDARRRNDEKEKEKAGTAEAGAAAADGSQQPNFLTPVMAAIAKELSGLADKDGVVRLNGQDEVAREKTAAVLRGIGQGLGLALAEAFGKWADKMSIQVSSTPEAEKPGGDGPKSDPPKQN